LTPNPNVLLELGYALYRLSWDRIICLNNEKFSKIEDMPFDLLQNRISRYSFDGESHKEEATIQLVGLLTKAIGEIIENFDDILEKEHLSNIHQHDIKIFLGLNQIISDNQFIDMFKSITTDNFVRNDEYKLMHTICEYLAAEGNQFLTEEINNGVKELFQSINTALDTLSVNLFPHIDKWIDKEEGVEKTEFTFHLPQYEEQSKDYAKFELNMMKRIEEIHKDLSNTIISYKKFRSVVKRHLFI
jgi:hypothetical protein